MIMPQSFLRREVFPLSDKKLIKTAGFMAAATLAAKFLGLIRDSLIAAFFATGIEADAFMTASKLPTMLFDIVIGGVISATFIPIFNKVAQKENKEQAQIFAHKFITMILMATGLIAVLGIVLADPLTTLLAPEYAGEKHLLTVRLTTIMFPMIIFTGLAFSFVGLLQSYGEYKIPSLISFVSNLAIILYFAVLGKRFGVYGLSVTMVVAWSLQVFVQIPSLVKFKFRFRLNFRLRDPHIKEALLLAAPMLISTWVQPLYSIINSRLASGINGAVASLEYANRLYIMVTGVFSFVVTNLVFPKLAKANAAERTEEAKNLTVNSLKAIVLVIAPLMAGFMILARPVTSVIYEHNQFTAEDVRIVSRILMCYSAGMLGLAVNEVLSKVFFSVQDSKTPMRNSILSMVLNIILAYVLFRWLKTPGLALAAAFGSMINAVFNWVCLAKRFPGIVSRRDAVSMLKMLLSAIAMAGGVYGISLWLTPMFDGSFIGNLILCAVSAAAGILIYGVCVYALGVDIVRDFLGRKVKK